MTRTLSEEGKRLIFSFEGRHKLTEDGRYAAYLCPAGVPTIYAGLTEGVQIGMVITEAEGEALFAKEIAKHEAAVNRLVTVEISQNEFDALVSLSYNIGMGGLSGSTVLKRLNKGDRGGAAEAFKMWDKATVGGKLTSLPGLISRREREAALFLKPGSAPDAPYMPHVVLETVPWSPWVGRIVAWLGGGTAITTLIQYAEAIIAGLTAASTSLADFVVWAIENPAAAAPVGIGMVLLAIPKVRERLA